MRKSRSSEEQIIGVWKQAEAGMRVADVCRQLGISEATCHRWRAKDGGLGVSEAKRLRRLEEENRRLKQSVADLTLDKKALEAAVTGSAPTGRAACCPLVIACLLHLPRRPPGRLPSDIPRDTCIQQETDEDLRRRLARRVQCVAGCGPLLAAP